ncbi:hypothetical protein NMK34_23980 [Micromonospora sp. BRA006-A]|uniref:hypothetical protein n=1 Tax=Micromonospora sp. BRA006-A TaxID=2962860 RepID=UPI00296EC0B2|nr:hypothetical protein [Micromonospora sp. BRA006-A]MDW3849678.1 hypothetical protein [Micromonospora sp. BRA006-A]
MLAEHRQTTNPHAVTKPNDDPGAQYIAFTNPDSTTVDTQQVIGWSDPGEGWTGSAPVLSTPDGPQALPYRPDRQYAWGATADDATRNLRWLAHGTPGVTVHDAVEVLYAHRHTLPADILRSLQSIYLCASAANYGQPYEQGWLDEGEYLQDYGDHTVAGCEAEDGQVRDTGEAIYVPTGNPEPVDHETGANR